MSELTVFEPGLLADAADRQNQFGRRGAHLLLWAFLLFVCVLAVQYFLKIQHAPTRSAFLRWGNQLEDLRQGINIWEVHEYPNPPIMAMILIPFALLPGIAGAMCWFVFKAMLTVLSLRWTWRMLEHAVAHTLAGSPGGLPVWSKMVAVLLVLGPIEGDLTHGNVNLFILFLLTVFMYSFMRGRDWQAGLLLGAAIACKLTPLLFVPYLAWKRAWKTLLGCLAGVILLWGVVPGVVFGFSNNLRFLGSWVDAMVVPYALEGKVTSEHQNQSLPGLLHRLLTHSPSVSERVGTVYFPREYHNLLDLDPGLVRMLVMGLMAGFGILIACMCRTTITLRRDGRLCVEFSLIILGMLLFSERTWKHHCVTLLLPCAVLAWGLARSSGSKMERWSLRGIVASVALLMPAAGSGLFPGQARLGDLAQVYGAYTWALLLLLGAMTWMARTLAGTSG